MKYLISTITDVVSNEENGDWEDIRYIDRTAPLAQEYGLGLELAEFCISDNMDHSFDKVLPHVAAVAYERYDAAWRFCLRFGAGKMIVHANYVEDLYFPSWFTQRHTEFWRRFLDEHPENITVCVENVMERKPELLLPILEQVNDPRLRMCLDVGHANLSSAAPADWLRTCAPFISHYHIHNNDGPVAEGHRSMGDRHAALDKGNIDMLSLLQTAEELTPDATAAIESYEPEACVRWLRDKGLL